MASEINNVNIAKYGTPKGGPTSESSSHNAVPDEVRSKDDRVEISKDAKTVERVSVSISESSAFDEKKVADITQAIREGRYPLDTQRIAEKFMELESQLNP
ncbi:MAG: flagellar biosynthesis anti-sigma factor FlgM [Pseudomonadales bacterium]|nr:flagellar biosynthesis anti-sigma factor FlgM [Pseudomonadales bacterium]